MGNLVIELAPNAYGLRQEIAQAGNPHQGAQKQQGKAHHQFFQVQHADALFL